MRVFKRLLALTLAITLLSTLAVSGFALDTSGKLSIGYNPTGVSTTYEETETKQTVSSSGGTHLYFPDGTDAVHLMVRDPLISVSFKGSFTQMLSFVDNAIKVDTSSVSDGGVISFSFYKNGSTRDPFYFYIHVGAEYAADKIPPLEMKYLPNDNAWRTGKETVAYFGLKDFSPSITVASTVNTFNLDPVGVPMVDCVVNYGGQEYSIFFGQPETGGHPFNLYFDISDLAPGNSAPMTITLKSTGKDDRVYNVTLNKSTGSVPIPTVATPVITATPASATAGEEVEVSITSDTEQASIYYTLDGSTPSTASTRYSQPITVTKDEPGNLTIKAIALKSGLTTSAVATQTVTFAEAVTPPTQTVAPVITTSTARPYVGDTVQVTMTSTTADASIYYTLDGTVPTTGSALYALPLGLSSLTPDTITVKAIAVKDGLDDSRVTTKVITFRELSVPVTPDDDTPPPSRNEANNAQTAQKVTDLTQMVKNLNSSTLDKLPSGVKLAQTENGKSIAVMPVSLTTGSANVGTDIMSILGGGNSQVGIEFTVSAGLTQPSATILVPGGFGKITEPGRLSYPMDYMDKAPDDAAMLAMVKGGKDASSVTAQVGGNFKLPVAATVTVSVKMPEGSRVRILKYDPSTGKLLHLDTATVKGGKLVFTTSDFGQLLFTTGNL